jgi:hypothetical protein
MENAHRERGFAEIAQNLTIFPDGTVAVCRSLEKIPAGIKGANTGGICIENLGNFDTGKDLMTADQRGAIIRVNALLCRKFSLRPNQSTIVYHHWFDLSTGARTDGAGITKSCPGTGFFGGNKVANAEANFISLIEDELGSVSGQQPAPPPVIFIGKVAADSLNVRAKPSASSKRIKTLSKGVIVNAFEESGNWCRIDPGQSHWVNVKFLEQIEG